MTDRNEFIKFASKDRGLSSQTVRDFISHAYDQPNNLTRTVIEERSMPFREVDVFSRLIAAITLNGDGQPNGVAPLDAG